MAEESWYKLQDFIDHHQKKTMVFLGDPLFDALESPMVSIVLITYNHVQFISQAIDGVLNQEVDFNYELIICDDGSRDGTIEILKDYQIRNRDRIKVILNSRVNNIKVLGKPCGIYQMTYGLLSTRGNYVAMLSGDDYWNDPLKLKKQVDFLNENKNCSYTYHDLIRVESNNSGDVVRKSAPLASDMPVTILAKNIFTRLPKQFTEVLQEDTFMKSMLLLEGEGSYIKDISPAVYRVHDHNVWGLADSEFKHESRILTAQKLLETYQGTEHESYFNEKLLEAIIMKSEFLVKSGNRKHSRISLKYFRELNKYGLLWLYLTSLIKKKIFRK